MIKLHPSAADRWCACPASPYLESLCPPRPSGPDALLGTAAHALAQWLIDGRRDPDPELAGTLVVKMSENGRAFDVVPVDDSKTDLDIVVTDKMISDVSEYVALVNRLRIKYPDANVLTEHPVRYADGINGRVDLLLYDDITGHVFVVDYKNGRGTVPVERNRQLMIYAAAGVRSLYLSSVTFVIVQPNADDGGPAVRKWDTSFKEMTTMVAEINSRIADARLVEERPELAPDYCHDGDHCKWCAATAICPAIKAKALAVLPERDAPAPVVESITDDEIGQILSRAGMARMWLDAVEASAVSRLSAGATVPGWKLVEGRTARKIADEKGLRDAAQLNGWPVTREVLRTLADLDKVVPKAELEKFITRPPGKPTLASADDKRPAILTKTALLEGL